MIEVVDGLDLTGIPLQYLDAYPFPAFVILAPSGPPSRPPLLSRDTDVTVRRYEDVSPFAGPSMRSISSLTLVWSNEKWLRLTEGRTVEECLDGLLQTQLQDWIENDEQRDFTLEWRRPALVLHLAKTFLQSTVPTHTFCIITSQTRPNLLDDVSPALSSSTARTSFLSSSSNRASTSTDHRTSFSTDFTSSSPRLVSSTTHSYFPSVSTVSTASASSHERRVRLKKVRREKVDLQSKNMQTAAEECWQMLEDYDWSDTKLGPRSEWSDTWEVLFSVVFQSKTQDCLWLGDDLQMIYNKPYATKAAPPDSYGRPARDAWGDGYSQLEPFISQALSGVAVYRENDGFELYLDGSGHKVEHYHTWRFVPIVAKDGSIYGIFNQSVETTDQVLAERRLNTTRELSDQLLLARTYREFYDAVVDASENNAKDLPFVLCYSVHQTGGDQSLVNVDVTLEASTGVPENHPHASLRTSLTVPAKTRGAFGPNSERMSSPTLSAISVLSGGSGRMQYDISGTGWPIHKALSTRQCVLVEDCRDLIHDYPLRIYDELPRSAIVVPISSDSSNDIPESVIIFGLSARRPFDEDYENWLHALRAQFASSLTSVKVSQEEAKRQEENTRMERAKAAWFRGAAHDLRSPLTLILGPIEDLMETNMTPSQRYQLQMAKRNVDRLSRLINALMDFSRLEAGRVTGRFVPLDLGLFISELAALFRPAVERMRVEFIVDIQPSERLVYVDPVLFETAISNLIGNALKYTETGTITVRLGYSDVAEISVIDTGLGIPRDEVGQVMEWYHRASSVVHSGTQGTGLGLALAKELIRLHDGELLVESQTALESDGAHGSTFTARVPLDPKIVTIDHPAEASFGKYGKAVVEEALRWVRDNDDSSSDGGLDSNIGSTTGTKRSGGEGMLFEKTDRILLVDDNLDMRGYIKQILSPYCLIEEASNGAEALALATVNPPDLILSDVMMPRMTGLELLEELRNNPETALIPVILASAVSGDETKVEALLKGAEDYISKPFKAKELLARVHLHLQVGKKRAKLERMFAEREVQVALLSDYCPSGIMRADNSGAITYANRAWRSMAGMDEDADPDLWPQFVDETARERIFSIWLPWLASGEQELRLTWKWLSGRTSQGLFIRLDQVKQGLTGLIGCVTDITYEEDRLLEAEQRRIEAEESKHQQELLIDLTSHEIRTPVSAILQCSSLVKENLVALKDQLTWSKTRGFIPTDALLHDLEEDVEALESIYQCGLVQERIAGDVLSLARIQLDMLSLHEIEMDLRKEARRVFSVFTSEAKMKKIELELVFGNSLDAAKVSGIKTDPVRLGQVVTNLISNAIRFTASGEVRKITVSYEVSFNPPAEDSCAVPSSFGIPTIVPAQEDTPIWLFVSVKDTGPGLGPKELAMLFKRFSQGNKMIHTRYGGSGLGLFICKKITELLGGRIEVKSELGHGSVFRFFIETRTVPPPSATATMVQATSDLTDITRSLSMTPTSSSLTSAADIGSSTPPPEGWESQHILIVEDNVINQTVLKRQIVKAGLTCDVANHGLEALTLLREADRQAKRGGAGRKKLYNVVLMDLEMPVMDGLTAIQEIRKAEAAGTMSRNMVIALTGNARQGQIDQALASGMDDVVIKPYVLANLLTKIKAMGIRRQELARAEEAM